MANRGEEAVAGGKGPTPGERTSFWRAFGGGERNGRTSSLWDHFATLYPFLQTACNPQRGLRTGFLNKLEVENS